MTSSVPAVQLNVKSPDTPRIRPAESVPPRRFTVPTLPAVYATFKVSPARTVAPSWIVSVPVLAPELPTARLPLVVKVDPGPLTVISPEMP